MQKRMTIVDELMAEKINYGGMCATREQAFFHAKKRCARPGISADRIEKAAEMFAFGPHAKAISDEEAARLLPFNEDV